MDKTKMGEKEYAEGASAEQHEVVCVKCGAIISEQQKEEKKVETKILKTEACEPDVFDIYI